MMATDTILPPYPGFDLQGWDLANTSVKIATDSLRAAQIGTFVCSNRSTLLLSQHFGFAVSQPLYHDSLHIPNTTESRDQLQTNFNWIAVC
jgi:hypothetical protein